MYIQSILYFKNNEFGFIILIDTFDFVLFIYYQNIIKEDITLKLKFIVTITSSLCYNKIGFGNNLGSSVCFLVIKSKRQNYL